MDRCPYCRSEDTDTPMISCSYCGTTQHGECRAEHGGCVVCGKNEPVFITARRKVRMKRKPTKRAKVEDHSLRVMLVGFTLLLFGGLGLYLLL